MAKRGAGRHGRRARAGTGLFARPLARRIAITALVLVVAAAFAAPLAVASMRHRSTATATSTSGVLELEPIPVSGPVGVDASWPQCKHPKQFPLPRKPAFAIIGVNDGVPGTKSACLAEELRWAAGATGGTAQPKLQFYLIGADPWQPAERKWHKPDWPRSNRVGGTTVAVPAAYGTTCTGARASRACAYVYGWWAARYSAALAGVRDPASYRYWIDVETLRDWNRDKRFNEAIIEGMVAYLTRPASSGGLGASAGIYSNAYFWTGIVGTLRGGSPLAGLDNWVPIGPATPKKARQVAATVQAFTPKSRVTIVQFVSAGIDFNLAVPVRK